MRLLLCTALAAAAVAAVVAAPAAAKIWFMSVGGDAVVPGELVATKIAGCPNPCPVRGVSVALGRGGGRGADVRPLTRVVGVVDRRGRLRFRVPDVQPGRYRLVARFAGRWMRASQPFAVAPLGT